MNTESLFEVYPWYRQHQQAVDTAALYLGIEVEQVLKGLDAKIHPQYPENEATEAA